VWCGRELEPKSPTGPARQFCGPAHRQAASRFKRKHPEAATIWGAPLDQVAAAAKDLREARV
jgi:hypothetical protein